MEGRYRVQSYMDNNYEVFESSEDTNQPTWNRCNIYPNDNEKSVFQGSLADCEAYIRLHEGGYM